MMSTESAHEGEEPLGWSRYFSQVAAFFEHVERQAYANPNRNYTEYVIGSLEVLWTNLTSVKEYIDSQSVSEENEVAVRSVSTNVGDLLNLLPPLASQWHRHLEQLDLQSAHEHTTKFHILKEQLEYLHSLSFSWTDIAQMLGVSRMTIYRRRLEYSMLSEPINIVSDSTLYELVRELRRELPDIGQSMVCGSLE